MPGEGLLELSQELLHGEAEQQPPRLLLDRQRRHFDRAHPQLVDPERHQAAQLPAQHLITLLGGARQVADLGERHPQPGVRDHQRGLLHSPRQSLDECADERLEGGRIAQRPAQRPGMERVARQGGLAVRPEAVALAVAHELAVAQTRGVQHEDVRRHRHRVETQEALNPRR
jgi:hypothetical protein